MRAGAGTEAQQECIATRLQFPELNLENLDSTSVCLPSSPISPSLRNLYQWVHISMLWSQKGGVSSIQQVLTRSHNLSPHRADCTQDANMCWLFLWVKV